MTRPENSSPRDYQMEIEIAAPRDAVWEALTSAPELQRWFPPEASVTPGPGGEILWGWGEQHDWRQHVEVWEPGTRLRTRYESGVPGDGGAKVPLFLDFLLEGEGGKTTLRLVHSGFGADAAFDGEYDGISRGWPVELRSLRLYLERHAGKDRQLAWSTIAIDRPHDEIWATLTGAGGFACDARIDALAEGDAFRIASADGDLFEGEALRCQSHEFSGIVRSHGDAFLRISVEDCGGTKVWVSLATYGQPAGRAEDRKARWDAMLGRLFAPESETARA